MTEREILLHCLARIAARLQLNRRLRGLGWTACGLFGLLALYQVLETVIDSAAVIAGLAPLLILAALAVVALFAMRLMQQPTLAHAAGAADARAHLKDELKSAYWFVLQARTTPTIDLALRHAAYTASHRPMPIVPAGRSPERIRRGSLALTAGTLAWLSPRLTYSQEATCVKGPGRAFIPIRY
jgi:Zn-dependent protease with chaperone function